MTMQTVYWSLGLFLLSGIAFNYVSLRVILFAFHRRIPQKYVTWFFTVFVLAYYVSVFVFHLYNPTPNYAAFFSSLLVILLSMKAISFQQVFGALRDEYNFDEGRFELKNEYVYSEQTIRVLTAAKTIEDIFNVRAIGYFLLIPTCCFHIHYAARPSIRVRVLVRDFIKLWFFGILGLVFVHEILCPLLEDYRRMTLLAPSITSYYCHVP